MAYFYEEPSRTFGEYLLVPGYSSAENVPTAVSLKTPLVKYRKGQEECPLQMNIPMISAIMQSVSGDKLAIALARQGGVSFIYGSQSIENEAAMVRRVKSFKAGYVVSDSNLAPTATLHDVLELKARTGHSTIAITADGTPNGKLLGIVASRDYRVNHTPDDACVTTFMTPIEKLVTAPANTSLHDCNNIIWDNKINTLPLVDAEGNLVYMVFRKDYDSHKANVNELLDKNKSYVVGAGINTRDYAQRVPALVEAGVDVLCIDSSEGYSEWQSRTIGWIREHYGDTVKVGAGNVVDAEGFRFLAEAGADFVKIGIGGGSICITRETKGIGRGQATAVIEVAKARDEYYKETGIYVPICSDGGIVYDYHMTLALAMGADEAYLVTDRAFGGSDTYATSYILSQAIKKLGAYDVILGGKQAIDGDTGQTAPSIAEHLGATRLTYVLSLKVEGDKVIAERQVEEGVEVIETKFPVLCTATKESNKPRYATVKGVMRSFNTEIGQITLADLPDADTTKMGLKGSPTKVKATFTPKRTANCVNIEGVSPVEIADNLIGKLVEAKVL